MVVAGQHDDLLQISALTVVQRDNQLLNVLLTDYLLQMADIPQARQLVFHFVLLVGIYGDVSYQEVTWCRFLAHDGIVCLCRKLVTAHYDGVEANLAAMDFAVDTGGNEQTGNVSEDELKHEEKHHVLHVVLRLCDDVIQDEGKEEYQHADKGDAECEPQL